MIKTLFILALLIFVPFEANAYACPDADPEKVLEEAYYIGLVNVEKIDRPKPVKVTSPKEVKFDPEIQIFATITPVFSYKGQIPKQLKIRLGSLECGIQNVIREGEYREIILYKLHENIFFAQTNAKLTNEMWAELRQTVIANDNTKVNLPICLCPEDDDTKYPEPIGSKPCYKKDAIECAE